MTMEFVEWNGKKYYRDMDAKNSYNRKYFSRRKQINGIRKNRLLHREVWIFHHGEIPNKMHIHHIDGNPQNNSIENLDLLSPKDHVAKHPFTHERYLKQIDHLNTIRKLASESHKTPEGIARLTKMSREFRDSDKGKGFHKKIAAMSYKNFVPITKNCKLCNKEFLTSTHNHRDLFCSRACTSQFRRNSKIDNVFRICEYCNNTFEVNKHYKKTLCSKKCIKSFKQMNAINK